MRVESACHTTALIDSCSERRSSRHSHLNMYSGVFIIKWYSKMLNSSLCKDHERTPAGPGDRWFVGPPCALPTKNVGHRWRRFNRGIVAPVEQPRHVRPLLRGHLASARSIQKRVGERGRTMSCRIASYVRHHARNSS